MLKLGENLKRLRVQNEQTQEQLAEVLGVSPQAVSRWEKGTTYPDITLLPAIANYFDITTDELLDVNIERKQQEIETVLEYNRGLHQCGKIPESIACLREKIKLYPKSAAITYELAHSLYMGLCREGSLSEEVLDEIIHLTNRAIQLDKGESYVTFSGKHLLCLAYVRLGRYDEAVPLAADMPSLWVSREMLLTHALQDDAEVRQRQHNLLTFMDLSILNLYKLSQKMDSPEKSITLLQKAISLAELLTGDDHKFYNERIFKCYLRIAEICCAMGKAEEAFDHLELALKYAVMFEERPAQSDYPVFWLEGYYDDRAKTTQNTEETLYQQLSLKIESESFALLHHTERYRKFVEKIHVVI